MKKEATEVSVQRRKEKGEKAPRGEVCENELERDYGDLDLEDEEDDATVCDVVVEEVELADEEEDSDEEAGQTKVTGTGGSRSMPGGKGKEGAAANGKRKAGGKGVGKTIKTEIIVIDDEEEDGEEEPGSKMPKS
jgi:hypothetical protein